MKCLQPAIKLPKALSRVRQPHAPRRQSLRRVTQRAGKVRDFQLQAGSVANRSDGDNVVFLVSADSVLNGILHKRLQHQRRNRTVEQSRVNLKLESQAVPESPLLNRNVVLEKFDFPGQWNFLRAHLLQGNAQQFAEPQQYVFGSVGILM